MKNFVVYEHINGLPSHIDTVNEELTDCVMEFCKTKQEVEEYVEKINKIQPTDKYGRKRNLYIHWH